MPADQVKLSDKKSKNTLDLLVIEETLATAPDAGQQDPAPADPVPVQPEETAPAQGGSPAVPMALAGLALVAVAAALFLISRRRGE